MLYDAVAVLVSEEGVLALLENAAARDFVCDAFAHLKFIAYSAPAMALFEKVGIAQGMDGGFLALDKGGAAAFVTACRKLRHWEREKAVKS